MRPLKEINDEYTHLAAELGAIMHDLSVRLPNRAKAINDRIS